MVLYYTLTKYQQLAAMLHKILYKKDETAHLYISNGNYIEKDYIIHLQNSRIFEAVRVFEDQTAWEMWAKVDLENEELLYDALDSVAKLCEQNLIVPIENYDDIYIFADHFPLGFTVAYKKIPYHYVEEAAGVHCCYELWMNKLLNQNNKFLYMIAKKIGVYGNADCVIDCYVDIEKQSANYSCDKAINFSVANLLKELNDYQIEVLLDAFGINKIHFSQEESNLALILTEYVSGSKVCTWREQKMLYGMFIDYLCEGMTVIVKPHPNDHQGIYLRWFPGIIEVDKNAPSELLPYCVDKTFDRMISFCSTSYVSLTNYSKEVFSYRNKDIRSEKLFRSMNRYYAATQMIQKIGGNFSVIGIGADILQIKHFLDINGRKDIETVELDNCEVVGFKERKILVIDSLEYAPDVNSSQIHKMMNSANDDDVFIFINTKNDVLFYINDNNTWAENTVAVRVEEIISGDETDKKEGWMFMYSKDKDVKKIFLTTRIDKMLENAGVEVKINCDNGIRERMLEGLLYATERKLILLNQNK